MNHTEVIERLRALAELETPANLGLEKNRAWRVACREAADLLEHHYYADLEQSQGWITNMDKTNAN